MTTRPSARAWRAREAALEKELEDVRQVHALEQEALRRDGARETEALRAYVDGLQATHAAALATAAQKAEAVKDSFVFSSSMCM